MRVSPQAAFGLNYLMHRKVEAGEAMQVTRKAAILVLMEQVEGRWAC